jgi:hypothetical protein
MKPCLKSNTDFRLRSGLVIPYLVLAAAEGIIFLVYLLALPQDPKNISFLGFSRERWFLFAGILTAVVLFATLFVFFQRNSIKAARIDTWLLAQKYRIPALLMGYFSLLLAVFVWLVLRKPVFFLVSFLENQSLIVRLVPYWGWALLLPFQLACFWFYEWKWAPLTLPSYLFLVSLIGFLALGLSVYQDYGLAWDEQQQVAIARANYNYISHRSDELLTFTDRYYGPVYEVILLRLTDNADNTSQMFRDRHWVNFIFFCAGVVAFFWLARRLLASSWLALIASLCLLLSPRIFSDSFYNTKDIPFMVAFIFAMLTMVLFLNRPAWETAVLHGGFSAFLIAIRVPGVFILATTLVFLVTRWIFQRKPAKVIGLELLAGSIYVIFTLGLTTFFWPILWQNPLGEFIQGLQLMSHYAWPGQLFYLGQIFVAGQIPWHYIPVWISISTPLLYLASFGVGVITMIANLFRLPGGWFAGKKRDDLLILTCFFGPLLAVIVLHSILYDAWRQMFFIYPSFLMTAMLGMRSVVGLLRRRLQPSIVYPVMLLTLVVGLLEPAVFMIRNHPYENLFFNALAGENMGQIKQRFILDYWGLSYRAGIEYILKVDPGEKIPIYVNTTPGKMFVTNFLPADLRARLAIMDSPIQARYFVGNYFFHPDEYPYRKKIYSVDVGGTSILSVFDLRVEPDNQSD